MIYTKIVYRDQSSQLKQNLKLSSYNKRFEKDKMFARYDG